jgi:hypothetical protein
MGKSVLADKYRYITVGQMCLALNVKGASVCLSLAGIYNEGNGDKSNYATPSR